MRRCLIALLLTVCIQPLGGAAQAPPSPSPSAGAPCALRANEIETAITWLAAYANQSRTLLGPPLREPGDAQQRAYEEFNAHALTVDKADQATGTPFEAALAALKSAYATGARIDPLVVDYAESLGAFRSETQTSASDPIESLPPDANSHAKALQKETLDRAEALRDALAALWKQIDAAKAALAGARTSCRP